MKLEIAFRFLLVATCLGMAFYLLGRQIVLGVLFLQYAHAVEKHW